MIDDSPKRDVQLCSESVCISKTFRRSMLLSLFAVTGFSRILSNRDPGILKWSAEANALNMDADLDPRRWNLRREFVDWMEESSPQPP